MVKAAISQGGKSTDEKSRQLITKSPAVNRSVVIVCAVLIGAFAMSAHAAVRQIVYKSGTNLLLCVNPKCISTAHVQRLKTTTYTVYGDNVDWTTTVSAGTSITVSAANKAATTLDGRVMGKVDLTFAVGSATPGNRIVTINWRNGFGITGSETFTLTVLRNPVVQSVSPLQVTSGRATQITIQGSDLGAAKIVDPAGATPMSILENREDRILLSGTWASATQQYTKRLAIGQQASTLLLVKAADLTILKDPNIFVPVYLGCYVDTPSRLLAAANSSGSGMTNESCQSFCKGYTYAGTEYSSQCFCGNDLSTGQVAPAADCNMPCSGNANQKCGGTWRLSVWRRQ